MMSMLLIREFIEDLKTQKTRALLTMGAITWGTLTLILLMAFGQGLSFRMHEGMANAADRIIYVWGGQTGKKFQGLPVGRRIRFVEDDCAMLQKSIPKITFLSPQMGKWIRLRQGDKSASTFMEGVYPTFELLRRMYPAAMGRFLNEKDLKLKRRSVFLGSIVAGELFGKDNPVGKNVAIDGVPFTVVGVLPKKLQTAMNNGPDDRRAIIPFSTFQSLYGYQNLNSMLIKPETDGDTQFVIGEIRRVLGRKYKFDATDENAVPVWDVVKAIAIQGKIFTGINIFMGVIGIMTLVIAGVGVANIMTVVVKERTQEIGIKRAVGAKRFHILFQFVFESLLLAAAGGVVGVVIASGVIKLMWMIPVKEGAGEFLLRPIVSTAVMGVAVGVLGLVGLFAGLLPARKAALVDPIEALHYE
jgi:putative ABC transport system permease protein